MYLMKIPFLSIFLKQKGFIHLICRGVNDICIMSGSNIVKLHTADGFHECVWKNDIRLREKNNM